MGFILVKYFVVTYDCQALGLRLRDEHSIKWVTMGARKEACPYRVQRGNEQRLEGLSRDDGVELGGKIGALGEFPDPVFCGDLPR